MGTMNLEQNNLVIANIALLLNLAKKSPAGDLIAKVAKAADYVLPSWAGDVYASTLEKLDLSNVFTVSCGGAAPAGAAPLEAAAEVEAEEEKVEVEFDDL